MAILALLTAAPRARAQQPGAAPVDSTTYPLVLLRGCPYAELELGGARGMFLVDTGANASGIDREWLKATGLPYRPGRSSVVGGTTGDVRLEKAVFERFALGSTTFVDATFGLNDLAHFEAPAPGRPQVGLLGTDFLHQFRLGLDLERGRMTLELRRERRPLEEVPGATWEPLACSFPLDHPTLDARLVAPVTTDGATAAMHLPCRLDTGAKYLDDEPRLDVNQAAVDALRARGVKLVKAGELHMRGISGQETLGVLSAPGLCLELGPVTLRGVRLVVHGRGTLAAVAHPIALASANILVALRRIVIDPFDDVVWVPVPSRP